MSLGANKLSPLEIEDARQAAHQASELQRACEDRVKQTSRALAEAERQYRMKMSTRITQLIAQGTAATAAKDIVRGEKPVADLRFKRDVAQGIFEAAKQECFRRGADRRDVHQLITWSQARDLRVDTPPADWMRREMEPTVAGAPA